MLAAISYQIWLYNTQEVNLARFCTPNERGELTAKLVTGIPVEFEKHLVEVQGFRKITDHSIGIYRIYL